MDFPLAIERNRQDLVRIVAMLFAAAGLVVGGSLAVVPRHVRSRVFRNLRSAEASLRRLLVVMALEMTVQSRGRRGASAGASKTDRRESVLCFPLIESLPGTGESPQRSAPGSGPRLSFLNGFDPARETLPDVASPEDEVDAAGLCSRLNAVQTVLGNLPKHARRIALWQARRDATANRMLRPRPVRLGRPAGYRVRGKHPVDAVLTECHALMLYALRSPDTG